MLQIHWLLNYFILSIYHEITYYSILHFWDEKQGLVSLKTANQQLYHKSDKTKNGGFELILSLFRT